MKINSVGSATHVHWTFDTLLTTRGCDNRSVTAPVKCLLKFVEVSRLTLLQKDAYWTPKKSFVELLLCGNINFLISVTSFPEKKLDSKLLADILLKDIHQKTVCLDGNTLSSNS